MLLQLFVLFLFCLLDLSLCQQVDVDYTDECPEEFGFYADAVQCDRYYECKNGEIVDHYCPDGLVFDESSTSFAKCSFPFSVNCAGRPELQRAQPTELCPRRNGYFAHKDPLTCDKFYFCVDGVANEITCPETLIFDPDKGQCAFSDQVTRKGCSSEEVFQFTCPAARNSPHEHPRYPDPNDCQYFYICIGGLSARRNGCTVGLVFNPDTLACDRPRNVQGPCREWYNQTYLEQLGAAERPSRPVGTPVRDIPGRKRVAVRRRRPPPPSANRVSAGQVPTAAVSGQLLDNVGLVGKRQEDPRASNPRLASAQRTSGGQTSGTRAVVPRRPVALGSEQASRNRNRSRVRTRVRSRPAPSPPAAVAAVPEEVPRRQNGPPKFSLSSDEAIQQFRQSNRFVPETRGSSGGGSRLTVLSTGSRRPPRPPPALKFEDESAREDSEFAIPFAAAVPSRRPPQPTIPRESTVTPTRRPAAFASVEENDGFGSRSRPAAVASKDDQNNFEPINKELFASFQSRRPAVDSVEEAPTVSASIHEDPYQTSFDQGSEVPPRREPDAPPAARPRPASRSRLQVTSINVRPQLDLRAQEPDNFEISRVQSAARSRGRARTRQRTRARLPVQEDGQFY